MVFNLAAGFLLLYALVLLINYISGDFIQVLLVIAVVVVLVRVIRDRRC